MSDSDYGRRTLDFLETHALSAEPIHYWVVHEFLQGRNEELVRAVDDRINMGKPFDAYFVLDMYERFVAGAAFRQFRGMGGDMEKLLGGLIENLRAADRSASTSGPSHCRTSASPDGDPLTVRNVVPADTNPTSSGTR